MKKCIMIINPNSGRKHKIINKSKIQKIFLKYGYEVSIIFTEYKGHASCLIQEVSADLVVSVGGDGTYNEIMTGNFKRKSPLIISHIPLGTANDIGAMYGYKRSLYKNIELLLNGKVKKIDICLINGRPFTYVAALGKFANVSYDTPRALKKKYGYLAYLIEGLKEFRKDTKKYSIEYNVNNKEEQIETSFILISNANRIAGINNFYKDIKLDDDCFEVLFCELTDKKEILRSLYYLKNGDISNTKGFRFYKTNKLVLNFKDKMGTYFSVDGEKLEDSNLNYEISIKKGVEILMPLKNIDKLFLNKE